MLKIRFMRVCCFALFLIGAAISVHAADPCNFAGGWSGTWFSIDGDQDWVNVELQQDGTQLSGFMDVKTADYGEKSDVPIIGSVIGNKANFIATYTEEGYTYTFKYINAILVKDPNQHIYVISGSYMLLENNRLWDKGTFSFVDDDQLEDRMPIADFTIQDITLTPAAPVAGRTITAQITVANLGTASANPGTVKIYHTGDEANALFVRVSTLRAGQQKTLSLRNKLTAVLGNTELIAVIDPDNNIPEKDETNNSFLLPYTGGQANVDVAITAIEISPESVPENSIFDAAVTVENIGSEPADAGYLQVYLDRNPIGRAMRVPRMNAGTVRTVRITRLPANVLMGQSIVLAKVDCRETLAEINEKNNTFQTSLTVTGAPKPDFVVQNINLIPNALVAGRTFSAEITVANTGNASGKPGYVKVFHLGDEANALLLRVPTLQSGQQRILKVMNKLTAVLGDIELIAVIDPDNDTLEQDETNNSRQMHYTGGQAQVDVAVTQIAVSPDSVSENSTFNAVVTVENTGSETADAGYLQIYLDGNPIGKASRVSRLNQGASKAVRMTRLPANVLMGQHIVAAMVDCHKTLTEVNELNNSLQTNLTVTEAPKPDLVITNIELSPAYPIPGESFSAYVWLQNVGKADSKDGYLDIWVDGDANGVPAQSIKLPLLTAGSEAVRTTISRLNSPGIIAEQLLIAIADADNEVLEEDEDNNYAELAYPNPLALYYPLNDGDWKTYTHSARIDADLNVAQSSTQRSVFNETKTIEGQQSIAMMGYDSGNLVSFGVYSEGQIIKFSTPMVLATAEQLSDGGVSQSSTSLTIQGIRVTLATESTVTVVPSVITPLGTFENCRELTYEARASAYGQDQGVLMANAAYYAPNTGPVKMKVVQMDQYGNMDFLYYMEITAGNVNGIPVLAP